MIPTQQSQRNSIKPSKPSQKQITALLCEIEGKPYELKNYRQLLQTKQLFEKEQYINLTMQITQILQQNQQKSTNQKQQPLENIYQHTQQQICKSCYEQINGKYYTCSSCKGTICKKCIYRSRQFKNNNITAANYCETCDSRYLEAVLNKQFIKEFDLYKSAFQTLIKQQQNLQSLIMMQKTRIKSSQKDDKRIRMLQNDEQIQNLKHQKQHWKQKIHQTKNKIVWGESMTKSLKIKHRKLIKLIKQSFGSSNNGDDPSQYEWQPPKAESEIDLQIENLNQSMITSMLEQNEHEKEQIEEVHKFNCQCVIF